MHGDPAELLTCYYRRTTSNCNLRRQFTFLFRSNDVYISNDISDEDAIAKYCCDVRMIYLKQYQLSV